MRKIIRMACAASLGALLGTTALAFTPTEGNPYDGTTLRVLAVTSSQFQAQEARFGRFTEATGITVQVDYVPFTNMLEALTAEMVGGQDYDLVTVMDAWTQSLDMLLQPIDDITERPDVDIADFPKVHLDRGYINGELNGLPTRGHVQLLFYRKDLLEQAGVAVPETWEDLAAAGQKIRETTGVAGVALPYGKLSGQNLMIWYNLLWGHGGDVFDAEGNPIFNSEAGIAATTQYVGFLRDQKVVPEGSATFTEQDAVNSFKQGNSAMLPVWWWVRSQLVDPEQSKVTADQLGFAPMPRVGDAAPTSFANTWVYGVTETTGNRDAALEFLAFVTDPALEREILLDPELQEVVAVHMSNLRDPEVNARWGGMHEAAAAAVETAPVIPYGPEWPRVAEILENMMSGLASGTTTDVRAELDRAAAEIAALR